MSAIPESLILPPKITVVRVSLGPGDRLRRLTVSGALSAVLSYCGPFLRKRHIADAWGVRQVVDRVAPGVFSCNYCAAPCWDEDDAQQGAAKTKLPSADR